jgi:hypothetical protein
MRDRPFLRLVLVNLAVFVALALVLEGASSFVRRARTLTRDPADIPPEPYIRQDPDLGWSPRPGAMVSAPGEESPLHVDAKGLRAARANGQPGRLRVVCSGDSFTFGEQVSDAATWCAQLEALDPRLATMNLGVPGYGVDQAYLRYLRDGQGLAERVHVFAFIDDDFRRMGIRRIKPYLTAADGRLDVHGVPVPPFEQQTRLGRAIDELNMVQVAAGIGARMRGFMGRPVDGPADGVLAALPGALAAAARARGSVTIVVRLPSPYRVSPHAEAFMGYARRSMVVVDLRERFDALPPPRRGCSSATASSRARTRTPPATPGSRGSSCPWSLACWQAKRSRIRSFKEARWLTRTTS